MKKSILLFCTCFLFLNCSSASEKERDAYKSLKSSFTYKIYKKTSIVTLEQFYKSNDLEKNGLSLAHYHSVMGLLWVLSKKPDFVIAESEIIYEISQDKIDHYRGDSLLIIGMYLNE